VMARPSAPTGTTVTGPDGYVRVKLPGHPLAVDGWVREHRLVLYTALGPGPQACHACGTPVAWDAGLEVDHLDHDRQNNSPANLAPICRACNNRWRRSLLRNNGGRRPA
jgi:hypothetical protein